MAWLVLLLVTPASEVGAQGQPLGDVQVKQAGQVTVAATWIGGTDDLAFHVVMDTHTVDLDRYDLLQLATLRTDQGVEVAASSWEAAAGAHHREGQLRFPAVSRGGAPLLGPETVTLKDPKDFKILGKATPCSPSAGTPDVGRAPAEPTRGRGAPPLKDRPRKPPR
jgi:hypothetical protein